jgi:uncharacterized membrane protein
MRRSSFGLAVVAVAIAAIVGVQELLYYLQHRRSGPALELLLLAVAVIVLAASTLLNRGR